MLLRGLRLVLQIYFGGTKTETKNAMAAVLNVTIIFARIVEITADVSGL